MESSILYPSVMCEKGPLLFPCIKNYQILLRYTVSFSLMLHICKKLKQTAIKKQLLKPRSVKAHKENAPKEVCLESYSGLYGGGVLPGKCCYYCTERPRIIGAINDLDKIIWRGKCYLLFQRYLENSFQVT